MKAPAFLSLRVYKGIPTTGLFLKSKIIPDYLFSTACMPVSPVFKEYNGIFHIGKHSLYVLVIPYVFPSKSIRRNMNFLLTTYAISRFISATVPSDATGL